jgi:hypothetical protein
LCAEDPDVPFLQGQGITRGQAEVFGNKFHGSDLKRDSRGRHEHLCPASTGTSPELDPNLRIWRQRLGPWSNLTELFSGPRLARRLLSKPLKGHCLTLGLEYC